MNLNSSLCICVKFEETCSKRSIVISEKKVVVARLIGRVSTPDKSGNYNIVFHILNAGRDACPTGYKVLPVETSDSLKFSVPN